MSQYGRSGPGGVPTSALLVIGSTTGTAADGGLVAGQASSIASKVSDLVDRSNDTSETVPTGSTTNCAVAGIAKTAPALAASVGTPPLRFAVKNNSTGTVTLAHPDYLGNAQIANIVPGETVTYRQKSTLGWGREGSAPMQSTPVQQAVSSASSAILLSASAALANRHYARYNEVWIGDSHTEGQGATAMDRRWIGRRRDILRGKFPTFGNPVGGRGFIAIDLTGTTSYPNLWTIAGSTSPTAGYGPKDITHGFATAADVATISLNCTSVDILYTRVQGTVSLKYSWDGGTTYTTFTAGGASALGGQMLRITPPSPGANTLRITWASGSTGLVDGVVEYNGDESSGIQVQDAGHYGWTSSTWNGSGIATPTKVPAAIAALSPSLIGISLGTNDKGIAMTGALFQSNLAAIIAGLRTAVALQGVPIILVTPNYGTPASVPPISIYSAAAAAAAAADVAAGNLTLAIDMSMRFPPGFGSTGTTANSPYGIYNLSPADVHMTDKGHALWAEMLAAALPPGA